MHRQSPSLHCQNPQLPSPPVAAPRLCQLTLAATVALSAAAWLGAGVAAAACKEVFFGCDLGDREPNRTVVWRTINLKQARSLGWSDSQIARKCHVDYSDPPGCSWRGGAGASGGGATIVLSNSGGYAAPTPIGPTAAPSAPAPTVRRDAWGRRSPTPAPVREEVPPAHGDAAALPDDGPWAVEIAQAAARYHLPPQLVRAVMTVESGGNPGVESNKGAVGLMQLLPATAKALGVEDIHDPAQNVMGGARFLRVLANRFDGDLVKVLSAYHAGSMRVASRDATPFAATDDYVRKVLKTYYQLRDAALRGSEI